MKIRQGFVSNSSTTSFCIMGDWMSHPDYPDDHKYCDWDMYDICETNGLQCHSPEGMRDYAVGLCPSEMNDDETLSQFKARVLLNMKNAGFDINDI